MKIVAVALALAIPLGILRGWVLSLLWGWYVTPLGVPAIGVVQAIGLTWLVGLLTATPSRNRDDDDLVYATAFSLTVSLLALAIGWAWTFAL